MVDDAAAGDAKLVQVVTRMAQRILAGERAYDVCMDLGELVELIGKAHHDGDAYVLWAEIGDLLGSPFGPQSETACEEMAAAAATDWLALETKSPDGVASYFERWQPAIGSSWLAQDGSWGPDGASAETPGH